MAEIRRSYSGPHPVKRYSKTSPWKPGQPVECEAQVLVVTADDGKLAISMNGTAVMTAEDLRELVATIEVSWSEEEDEDWCGQVGCCEVCDECHCPPSRR